MFYKRPILLGVIRMKLIVTPAAVSCFKNEWGFREGDQVRIFVRYSGMGEDGPYSLGISHDTPMHIALSTVQDDITFYMEHNDVWYLEGRELTIDGKGEDIMFVLPK